MNDDGRMNGRANGQATRPTPHFFWQSGAENENATADAAPSARDRLREKISHSPRPSAHPGVDKSAFEPPEWARQPGEGKPAPGRAKAVAIASLLTVACGVGLGVALLQIPSDNGPLKSGTSLLPAAANVAATPAVTSPTEPAEKPEPKKVTQRIAPVGDAAAPAAKAVTGANEVVVAKTSKPLSGQQLKPDPVLAGQLRTRGDERIVLGDIIAARSLYLKAATLGDAKAAMKLGQTYDPVVLKELGVVGPKPDRKLALHWYRLARDAGLKSGIKLGQAQ